MRFWRSNSISAGERPARDCSSGFSGPGRVPGNLQGANRKCARANITLGVGQESEPQRWPCLPSGAKASILTLSDLMDLLKAKRSHGLCDRSGQARQDQAARKIGAREMPHQRERGSTKLDCVLRRNQRRLVSDAASRIACNCVPPNDIVEVDVQEQQGRALRDQLGLARCGTQGIAQPLKKRSGHLLGTSRYCHKQIDKRLVDIEQEARRVVRRPLLGPDRSQLVAVHGGYSEKAGDYCAPDLGVASIASFDLFSIETQRSAI